MQQQQPPNNNSNNDNNINSGIELLRMLSIPRDPASAHTCECAGWARKVQLLPRRCCCYLYTATAAAAAAAALQHCSTFINNQINHQKFNRKRIKVNEKRLQSPPPPACSHDKKEAKNLFFM